MVIDDGDVPYGEDFHDEAQAAAWAEAAIHKRPFRPMIFERFASGVLETEVVGARVLELGSGPGFLAAHVLDRCASIARYTLLDFSAPMLAQGRRNTSLHAARTRFVQASFKDASWPSAVDGPFDFVLSLQAVHELRHKRHAPRLYEQVRSVMAPGGELFVCDHLPGIARTPQHRLLYMSVAEHLEVFANAGFIEPRLAWSEHEMAMYRARA